MRRSGKASDKAVKRLRHRTLKRRHPEKVGRKHPSIDLAERVALLEHRLNETLDQQTATSEILRVIASSPTEIQSVLDAIVTTVARLIDVADAHILRVEGQSLTTMATHGSSPQWAIGTTRAINRNWVTGRAVVDGKTVHVRDLQAAQSDFPEGAAYAKQYGHRTTLATPLLREGSPIGAFLIRRNYVKPFTNKQIELLQNFAAQAVIAIENTRLLNELRESLQQQTATADVLKVISSSPGDLKPVFEAMLANAVRICGASFGVLFRFDEGAWSAPAMFGVPPAFAEYWQRGPQRPGPRTALGRVADTKLPVHIADVKTEPAYIEGEAIFVAAVDLGGFRTILNVPLVKENELLGALAIYRTEVNPFGEKQIQLVSNFAAQAVIAIENTRLLTELRQRTKDLSTSLENLRATQDRLVQNEKLASLGQLTAGIAHEIKNPLNFVNNFSGISSELVAELQHTLSGISIDQEVHAEINELTDTLRGNLEKVVQHGKRADAIVKSMLLHSVESSSEHKSTDINALVDESLNRAYYNARAEQRGFAIKLERSFDPTAGEVDLFPREITRALLNLISNGFYAATKRKEDENGSDQEPTLTAATKNLGSHVEIRIRDNGSGIPADVKEKMFDPFFTTKPAGEGTGLGLSISHDIIVKQHGGSIEVDTEPGEFAEIRVILPRVAASLREPS